MAAVNIITFQTQPVINRDFVDFGFVCVMDLNNLYC
jgi:hypothetical protein